MINLYLENTTELEFDGDISVKLNSPLLASDVSHSFDFLVKHTQANKEALKYLHLPEVDANKFPAKDLSIISDIISLRGQIRAESVNQDGINLYFIGQNNFWERAKELKLTELDTWFYYANGTKIQQLEAEYLPVENVKYFSEFPYNLTEYIGKINAMPVASANHTDIADDAATARVPMPRLGFLLARILQNLSLNLVKDDFNADSDLSQLYLYSNTTSSDFYLEIDLLPSAGTPFIFYCIIEVITDDDDEKQYKVTATNAFYVAQSHELQDGDYVKIGSLNQAFGLDNTIFRVKVDTASTFFIEDALYSKYGDPVGELKGLFSKQIIRRNDPAEEEIKYHVPDISMADFVKEIEIISGTRLFVNESTYEARVLSIEDIVTAQGSIDITKYAGPVQEIEMIDEDGYSFAFDAPEDDYYKEQIKALEDNFTIKDAVATTGDLPATGSEANDVRYVTAEDSYYRFKKLGFQSDAGWEFYTKNLLDVLEGEGDLQFQSKFSPVLMYHDGQQYVCKVEKEGSFLTLNEVDQDDFRLMFYRGVYQQNGTNKYVKLVTNDVYDHEKNKIDGANLRLRWDTEYGIIEQRYKNYLNWKLNVAKPVTCPINWPSNLLQNFDFSRKYSIKGVNYFVQSIELTLRSKGKALVGSTYLVKAP